MKRRQSLFYHIFVFVLAQLAWLALLGLWIYWYVSNYIILEKVGDQLPQILYDETNIVTFVGGLILLVGISFSMVLIFRHLSVQLKLNKLYDNFIANVTHELKSPLSSIQLYLETLKDRNVSPNKQKEFIDLMMKDAGRLKNLINSILDISALEQKKVAYDFRIYTTDEIVNKLVKESKEQFNIPDDNLRVEGKAPCKCVADKNALKIVFDNLIDNAIKYSIKPVEILVKINCGTHKIQIDFIDNGVGIVRGDRKKIFNKFQRIYGKDVPSVKGTGLGLYWVKEIIKFHGGNISVVGNDSDSGSVFKIELPVYQFSKKRFIDKLLKRTEHDREMGVIHD